VSRDKLNNPHECWCINRHVKRVPISVGMSRDKNNPYGCWCVNKEVKTVPMSVGVSTDILK